MICERCNKNPATVHVTKVVNGKKTEIHLCEQCAKENEKVVFDHSFSINNFLAGLIDSVQDSPIQLDYVQTQKCSKCGMTYEKFKHLGRLGCAQCYRTFDERLSTLVKRVQGNEHHVGKVPKKSGNFLRIRNEIKVLKNQLNEAIKEERFENAAVLRDRIRELENQLKNEEGKGRR